MADILLSSLKRHPKNPRIIKDARFEELKKSLKEFPKMMELRPIVTDEKGVMLAGNMRHAALVSLGYTSIPRDWVKKAKDLTQEEKDRFMVMDNDHFGEWDHDVLVKDWNVNLFKDWGLSVPMKEEKTPELTSTRRAKKGQVVRIVCDSKEAAQALFTRMIAEGLDAELK